MIQMFMERHFLHSTCLMYNFIGSIDHNECTEEQFHASNNFLNCEVTHFKENNLHYAKTYMPNVIITSIRKQLLCFMRTNIMLF